MAYHDLSVTDPHQKEVGIMRPKKILYCTDFSDNSEPARKLALGYAKDFGAQLQIGRAHV